MTPRAVSLLGRRSALALVCAMPLLAACADGGPLTAAEAEAAVRRRLEELRDRFVAGDMRGMPPEVTERMDEAQRETLRRTVGRAEIAAFRGERFVEGEEGRWRGAVSLDVRIPSPVGPVTLLYRVTAGPVIQRVKGRWTVLSFASLRAELVRDARWEAT